MRVSHIHEPLASAPPASIAESRASGFRGLRAEFAGEFGEEAVHRDWGAPQKLMEQSIRRAALSGCVTSLKIEQRISLPRRHTLVQHRFALRFGRNINVFDRAARM